MAQKTKQAHEAQKKAFVEAQIIIANNQMKQTEAAGPQPVADTPSTDPPVETTKNVLTTTQWLSVISIIISLAGVYYKCEEIERVFTKPRVQLPSPVLPQAPHYCPPPQKWESERWIEHFICFFITMVPKIDVLQASIKAAAISGIALVWVNFTIEAFKFAWHIVSTSPEKETWKELPRTLR